MVKAAIFDFDGTLVDSMWVWDGVATRLLQQLGRNPKAEDEEKMRDMSLTQAAQFLIENYSIEKSVQQIIDTCTAIVEKRYQYVNLKPGIGQLVRWVHGQNVRCCVLTASPEGVATAALERLGLGDCFEKVTTCEEIGYAKDDPNSFLKIAEEMGAKPKECMVLDDSLYAVKAASQAGFKVLAVEDFSQIQHRAELWSLCTEYLVPGENLFEKGKKVFCDIS